MKLTEEHKRKLAEGRSARKIPNINVAKLAHRRRELGEYPNRSYAIQNFCLECMGWETNMRKDIRECPAPKCWLYPWRMGKFIEDDLEYVEPGKPWEE